MLYPHRTIVLLSVAVGASNSYLCIPSIIFIPLSVYFINTILEIIVSDTQFVMRVIYIKAVHMQEKWNKKKKSHLINDYDFSKFGEKYIGRLITFKLLNLL